MKMKVKRPNIYTVNLFLAWYFPVSLILALKSDKNPEHIFLLALADPTTVDKSCSRLFSREYDISPNMNGKMNGSHENNSVN